MKKLIFLIFVICALSIGYITIRVETIRLCYDISNLYNQKDKLYAEKQFALCRLLRSISPENVEQRIALESKNLGFNVTSRIVLVDASHSCPHAQRRLTWREKLFGEKQALAESIN